MMIDSIGLQIQSCVCRDEKLYCLARDLNLLFSVDIQDGTVTLMDAVPEEDILTSHLFTSIRFWENALILVPDAAQKIWIYDLTSQCWDGLSDDEYAQRDLPEIDDEKERLPQDETPDSLCVRLDNGMQIRQTAEGDLSIRMEDASERVIRIAVGTDQFRRFLEEIHRNVYEDQVLYTENPDHPLLSLQGFLAFAGSHAGSQPSSDGTIGAAIWEKIR